MSDTIRRSFPAYVKGTPAEVYAIEEEFMEVWAKLGLSRVETITKAFTVGLRALAEEENLEPPLASIIQEKHQEIMRAIAQRGQLELIYEHLSRPEFVKFCKDNGIDHQEFLRNYEIRLPSVGTKSKMMRDWLRYVLVDGDKHTIADIKQKAKIENIIRDETDWSLMKNIASRAGYSGSGERGCWQEVKS